MTGFNRRLSPFVRPVYATARPPTGRTEPLLVSYRMDAGHLPDDHWVHGPEGGRFNLGEACHIYDLFTFLTGARAMEVAARGVRGGGIYGTTDNFVATVGFDDGSVAALTYSAMGSPTVSKERMDLYVDGTILQLDDYRKLSVDGSSAAGRRAKIDKGHRGELEALVRAISHGGDWPIPLWQQLQATEIALQVQAALTDGNA